MEGKIKALKEKHAALSSQLAQESLNSERKRVLNWKVQKVEEKLKFLEERKEQIARGENPTAWGRGGRGMRGRGCWGQEQQNPVTAQPQSEHPPEGSITPTPTPTPSTPTPMPDGKN